MGVGIERRRDFYTSYSPPAIKRHHTHAYTYFLAESTSNRSKSPSRSSTDLERISAIPTVRLDYDFVMSPSFTDSSLRYTLSTNRRSRFYAVCTAMTPMLRAFYYKSVVIRTYRKAGASGQRDRHCNRHVKPQHLHTLNIIRHHGKTSIWPCACLTGQI